MSDSHRSHLHTATAVTRMEHRQQLVRYYFGMADQPATEGMILMLPASSGTTETAWLSDTGAYGHCACQMWALFRSNPLTGIWLLYVNWSINWSKNRTVESCSSRINLCATRQHHGGWGGRRFFPRLFHGGGLFARDVRASTPSAQLSDQSG